MQIECCINLSMRGGFAITNVIFASEIWTSYLSDITFVGAQGICVWTSLMNLLLPWVHMKHFQEGTPAGKWGGVRDLQLLCKKPETALEPKR